MQYSVSSRRHQPVYRREICLPISIVSDNVVVSIYNEIRNLRFDFHFRLNLTFYLVSTLRLFILFLYLHIF